MAPPVVFAIVMVIPQALAEATILREGAAGRAWLHDLPSIVAEACNRWGCVPDGDAWHGQVALVMPVRHAGGSAVLKISFPHAGNRGEADALRCFDGRGAIRLIDADDSGFVLLVERADPLTLAKQLSKGAGLAVEEALEVAGGLARQLAVPASPAITSLASTMEEWEKQLGTQIADAPGLLSEAAIAQARRTMHYLADDATSTMLHGDLHFGNILRSRREPWLAIDPKGWRGPSAWDTFTVIAGRREELRQQGDISRGVSDRVQRFSTAAGIGPDLAAACCQARAVSSYLYQNIMAGSWFDLEFLRVLAQGG